MQYSAEQLDKINVHQLRILARKLGVKSPTTLTKEILKQEIIDIVEGKKSPSAPTKQGRPPKTIENFGDVYKTLSGAADYSFDSNTEYDENMYGFGRMALNQNVATFGYDSEVYVEHVEGYVELLQSGSALIRPNRYMQGSDITIISADLVHKYDLRYGDKIVADAKAVSTEQPKIVQTIISINDIPTQGYQAETKTFKDLKYLPLNKKIDSFGKIDSIDELLRIFPIYHGSITLVQSDNYRNLSLAIRALAEKLAVIGAAHVIYLNPTIGERELAQLSSISNLTIFSSEEHSSFSTQQRVCTLAISVAERIAERGKRVLLIVDNLLILAVINNLPDGDIPLAKKLLSIYKNTEKGSVSVISGYCTKCGNSVENTICNIFSNADIIYQTMPEQKFGINYMFNVPGSTYNILNNIPIEDAKVISQNINKIRE